MNNTKKSHNIDFFIDLPKGRLLKERIVDFQTMESARTSQIITQFFISKFPVTNAQFYNFIQKTEYSPANTDCYSYSFYLSHWDKNGAPPPDLENHPVTFVNHDDAMAYAQFMGGRLPTYEELLYAAFGKTDCEYPWGDDFSKEKCNVRESGFGGTTPVGSFSPDGDSPFGCADMIGNVWEWASTPAGDEQFIALGSAWDHYAAQIEIPLDKAYRNHSVGFRVVRD